MRHLPRRRSLHAVAPPRPRADLGEAVLVAAGHVGLALAIAVGATVGTILFLLLLTIAWPIAAFLLAWIAWRSDRSVPDALARLRTRWGRSAHVVHGGLPGGR
jgi:hypothetical protein